MQSEAPPHCHKKPIVRFKDKLLTSDQCLHALLGSRIDLRWHSPKGCMDIAPSTSQQFAHQVQHNQEYFAGVPFFHKIECPLLDHQLQKNNEAIVSPCVVVLIQNRNTRKILATQRHERMSFGNLWVLPGGHLEGGESIFEGGIRQCIQEVGLKLEAVIHQKDPQLMVWESVNFDSKSMRIKRAALVVFFRIQCQDFEVREQKEEVKQWQWRSFEAEESPWGGGWAEGHLRYLQFLRDSKSL